MATLANTFVWALLVAGVLGTLEGALGNPAWLAVPQLLAFLVAMFSMPFVYLAMALGPRLPKRALLPLCWIVPWLFVVAMPLPLWLGVQGALLVASIVQSFAATATLLWLRTRTGSLGVTTRWLDRRGPAFSFRHLLGFTAAHLVLVPLLVTSYVVGNAAIALPTLTDGYVLLRPDGLYMRERILEAEQSRVRLIGMIHVADESFYTDISSTLRGSDQIVLREGVTDRGERLGGLDYGNVAESLGLETQQSQLVIESPVTRPEEIVDGAPYSDVDTSEMSEGTVSVLKAVSALYQDFSGVTISRYFSLTTDPEISKTLLDDILTLRNERVLESADAARANFEQIVIPWGALHMRGIEDGLRDRGFIRTGEKLRRAIGFW